MWSVVYTERMASTTRPTILAGDLRPGTVTTRGTVREVRPYRYASPFVVIVWDDGTTTANVRTDARYFLPRP